MSEIKGKGRNSNVELLRILMTFGVIVLHYNNRTIGGGFSYAEDDKISLMILYFLESLFICAVDVFVIISGYFLSQTNKRSIGKAMTFIIEVSFFRFCAYSLRTILSKGDFVLSDIIVNLLPYNWFIICYVALYLISPLINKAMNALDMKGRKHYVILALIVFCGWASFVDIFNELNGIDDYNLSSIGMYGSERGYTIVNFVVCYILGMAIRWLDLCDLRIRKLHISRKMLVLIILSIALVLTVWSYFDQNTAWEYCNLFVVAEAFCFVLLFLKFDIKENKFINTIAGSAISVYLLHGYLLKYIGIDQYASRGPLILVLHLILSTAIVFIVCFAIDFVKQLIFGRFLRKLSACGIVNY